MPDEMTRDDILEELIRCVRLLLEDKDTHPDDRTKDEQEDLDLIYMDAESAVFWFDQIMESEDEDH